MMVLIAEWWNKMMVLFAETGLFALNPKTQCIGRNKKLGFSHPWLGGLVHLHRSYPPPLAIGKQHISKALWRTNALCCSLYLYILYSTLLSSTHQWPGRFLGIIGWDPSDSKSNRLTSSVLLYSCEVYFIDSSKMNGMFPEVFNFHQLFLKLNWFIYN